MQMSKDDQRLLAIASGFGGGLVGALRQSVCILLVEIAGTIHKTAVNRIAIFTIYTPFFGAQEYKISTSGDSCLPDAAFGIVAGAAYGALAGLAFIGGRTLTFRVVDYIRDLNRA